MKKFLIVSMTCGEGHNSMAKSLKQAAEDSGNAAEIVQLFSYSEKQVKRQNSLYLAACKYVPKTYTRIWNKIRSRNPDKRDSLSVHKSVKKTLPNLLKIIGEYRPDYIISVHPYAGVALCDVKEKLNGIKHIGFVTDYVLCPYWEANIKMDYVVAPSRDLVQPLMQKGFKEEQIKVLGIPVHKKFSLAVSQKDVRQKLNLKDTFTVLSISGGYGLGNPAKLMKNILKAKSDVQIICINGKNEKSKNKIEQMIQKNRLQNVVNLGFVNNVEEYMKSADVIIGRSGGNGLAEMCAVNTPFILRENAIINEKLNKEIFIEKGIAYGMNKITDIAPLIDKLCGDPTLLANMKQAQEEFHLPDAADKAIEFMRSI